MYSQSSLYDVLGIIQQGVTVLPCSHPYHTDSSQRSTWRAVVRYLLLMFNCKFYFNPWCKQEQHKVDLGWCSRAERSRNQGPAKLCMSRWWQKKCGKVGIQTTDGEEFKTKFDSGKF